MIASFLVGVLFYFCSTPYEDDTRPPDHGKGAQTAPTATPFAVDISRRRARRCPHATGARFDGFETVSIACTARDDEDMPLPFTTMPELPASLVADLQHVCEVELGRGLTLAEAEDVGRRMLATFSLLFEIRERTAIHRSSPQVPLTSPTTNETVSMP
ncbi:MAG: hypothetical protein IT379_30470 [Deltaproteobacteria bacterium]|nr:hypothetical protein [Deltaproteobacteria bacterium]